MNFKNVLITTLVLSVFLIATNANAEVFAYYNFDEEGAVDVTGNGHDGVVTGAAWSNGKYYFDGEDDFIGLGFNISPYKQPINPFNPEDNYPQLTMGAWVKPEYDPSERSVNYTLISNNDGGLDRSLGIFRVNIDVSEPSKYAAYTGKSILRGFDVTEEWAFIAVAYNHDAGFCKLFVNGQSITDTIEYNYDKHSILNSHYNANIGRSPRATGEKYFKGWVDDVFFSDEFLSDGALIDIMNIQHAPIPSAGLILFSGITFFAWLRRK